MAKRSRRPSRSSLALRWLAVGALVLVGLLYYRPVRTYYRSYEYCEPRVRYYSRPRFSFYLGF